LVTGSSIALILAPTYGMVGLIATLIVSPLPGPLYGLHWIKSNLGIEPEWQSSGKIYLSVALSGVPAALLANTQLNVWLKLFGGAAIFLIIYLSITRILHIFDKGDKDLLRAILGERGVLSRLGNRLIDLL
jgi:hypothetical protein